MGAWAVSRLNMELSKKEVVVFLRVGEVDTPIRTMDIKNRSLNRASKVCINFFKYG